MNVAGKEVNASNVNVAGREATNSNANVVGKAATTSNVNLADKGTNNSNVNVGNQKNLKGTISPITELNIQNGGMIRTGAVDTRVPSNSLFSVTPTSNSQYLIETDPNFSDYRKWLSSDYMLKLVDYDPGVVQKRLGDGFYEQNLIRSEVTALTGKRFLSGYYSDEDQYQAYLMFRKDKKVITKYIKKEDFDTVKEQLDRRKKIKSSLKSINEDLKIIGKVVKK